MNVPRIKFVVGFIIGAFAFLLVSTLLLAQPPESFLGSASQENWQAIASTILSPVKVILMGPLLPWIKFLHQDPDTPPPFFLIGFTAYWTVLAIVLHFMCHQFRHLFGKKEMNHSKT